MCLNISMRQFKIKCWSLNIKRISSFTERSPIFPFFYIINEAALNATLMLCYEGDGILPLLATITFLIGRYSLWGAEWTWRERAHALLTARRPRPPRTVTYLSILGEKKKKKKERREENLKMHRDNDLKINPACVIRRAILKWGKTNSLTII